VENSRRGDVYMSIMMYIRTSLLSKDHKAFDEKYSIWPYRNKELCLC